ncbi:MAG: cytochrome c family protein [Lentisphaerae bacterium]|nr:cytochrome c family protein [Lentisphaerota bacterium]
MSKMGWGLRLMIGCGVMAGAVMAQAADRDAANYAGTKMCGICHKKAESGDQLGVWQKSPHAKAFETLGTPEAKEAAAKLGIDNPQASGKCLKCHSTAYNFTETLAATKIKPEEGVTCESCHGPGKNYMKKEIMQDQAKSIAAGLVHPATDSCTLCHNDQNPTWKADRYTKADGTTTGFDVDQAVKKIEHPNPSAKK